MLLSSSDKNLAEGKVLILYILNKIGKPVTNEALLKVVCTLTDMNYFYFQQFLLDLVDSGYVLYYSNGDEMVYSVTPEGKETLNLTIDIIPGIRKLRIDSNLKDNLDKVEEEISITADFIPHSESEYSVRCKVVENSVTMFEIITFAGSREHAKQIADNWKENATEIYPQILELLTGES